MFVSSFLSPCLFHACITHTDFLHILQLGIQGLSTASSTDDKLKEDTAINSTSANKMTDGLEGGAIEGQSNRLRIDETKHIPKMSDPITNRIREILNNKNLSSETKTEMIKNMILASQKQKHLIKERTVLPPANKVFLSGAGANEGTELDTEATPKVRLNRRENRFLPPETRQQRRRQQQQQQPSDRSNEREAVKGEEADTEEEEEDKKEDEEGEEEEEEEEEEGSETERRSVREAETEKKGGKRGGVDDASISGPKEKRKKEGEEETKNRKVTSHWKTRSDSGSEEEEEGNDEMEGKHEEEGEEEMDSDDDRINAHFFGLIDEIEDTCARNRVPVPSRRLRDIATRLSNYLSVCVAKGFRSQDSKFVLSVKREELVYKRSGKLSDIKFPMDKLLATLTLSTESLFRFLKASNKKVTCYTPHKKFFIRKLVRLSDIFIRSIPCKKIRELCT